MKYNALLKYVLFESDETARARIDLLRVTDSGMLLLYQPVLWRVRLALPLHDFELKPAELESITQQSSTKGSWTAVCFLVAPANDWPLKDRRLRQEQCVIEMEQLQRNLFHEEREGIGEFINRRMFERRNS